MAKQITLDSWLLLHFSELLKKGSLNVAKTEIPIALYRTTIEEELFISLYFGYDYQGGKSGHGMISRFDGKTNTFIHKDMWVD